MLPKLFPLLLLLAGCSTLTAKPFVGPDGSPNWVSLTCTDQGECMSKAGEVCPHGYQVMSNERRREVWDVDAGFFTRSKGHMVLRCTEPALIAPEPTAKVSNPQNLP